MTCLFWVVFDVCYCLRLCLVFLAPTSVLVLLRVVLLVCILPLWLSLGVRVLIVLFSFFLLCD